MGAKHIADRLSDLPSLKELHLNNCQLHDDGVRVLSMALPHAFLQTLFLDNNGITNDGANSLAEAMSFNQIFHVPILKSLHLSGNDITWVGAKRLFEVSTHIGLNDLWLGNNQIDRPRLHAWLVPSLSMTTSSSFMDQCCQLCRLNLNGNNLGDSGVTVLASMFLNSTSTLQELSLGNNYISDVGAISLASSLEENQHLERLDLSGNIGITTASRMRFAYILENFNVTLRELDLNPGTSNDSVKHPSWPFQLKSSKASSPDEQCTIHGDVEDELSYYLKLNAKGRKLICSTDTAPSIWPYLLSCRSSEVVYGFLQLRPEIASC
jgi:Ran GTPase-activating protein (RanGAP) involved in mRNA processing and transport